MSRSKYDNRDDNYGEATTLPRDKKSNPPPLLELSPKDRLYYKRTRRLSGIRYSDLEYVPLDPKLDPLPFRCFSCWGRDHKSRACMNPIISLFCRNCGRRDVDLKDCPRCSRAYYRETAKKDADVLAEAVQEAKEDAMKDSKKKSRGADPLLDVSLFVNEGSVAGDDDDDDDAPRCPLETIKEESDSKFDFTRDMVSDVEKLMTAVKHLSVQTQDRVLCQWLMERQKNL